ISEASIGIQPYCLYFPAGVNSRSLDLYVGGADWNIASDQPWMTADPSSGVGSQTVSVMVDRTGLSDGVYTGTLLLTSGAESRTVPVEMVVASGPLLSVNPTSLDFTPTITSHSFGIGNIGTGTLDWSLTPAESWIEITTPISGSGDAGVFVRVDPAAVPPGGPHTGHIAVDSNGGTATVTVQFDPASPFSPGVIGLYSDPTGTDCNIEYPGSPALYNVYVVHSRMDGATACQFAAPIPPCWTNAVYLSDGDVYPVTIGNSQCGKAIGYGMCFTTTVTVLTIHYFVQGPPTEYCCLYPVVPDPGIPSGEIEIADCVGNVHDAKGGFAIVNPDASCMCGEGTVRAEEATWGRIKAMYRE
ncbi:MAG: BACON domain-containing protein, partial [Candidatus Latescibacterota bacterium]